MAWGTIMFAPLLYGILRYLIPPLSIEEGRGISIGSLASIPLVENGVKLLKINKKGVFIYKNDAGQLTAFSAMCTHLGCLVEYQPGAHQFKCNCHGSVFDITGKNIAGPAPRPLPPYRVVVQGDDVIIYQPAA